jgi:CysZ protein
MTGFFNGVHYLFAGFGLITKPGIKRYVVMPFIINILIFSLLFLLFRHYVGELNAWAVSYLPAWLQWLQFLIWILFFIGFVLVFIFAFAALGALTAAPFNGLLAEKVECYLTGKHPAGRGVVDNVKDVPRVIGRQLAIIFYYASRAVGILILFFVPVVHGIAPILWILFSAWYLTLQFIDFPTDNHRVPIATVRAFLGQRRAVTLGFGLSLLFAIPAAAAGAAKFWLDENGAALNLA